MLEPDVLPVAVTVAVAEDPETVVSDPVRPTRPPTYTSVGPPPKAVPAPVTDPMMDEPVMLEPALLSA